MSYEFQPKEEENPQPEISAEEFLAAQKSSIRKKACWALGIGGFVVAVHIGWLILFSMLGAEPDTVTDSLTSGVTVSSNSPSESSDVIRTGRV